MTHASDSPDDTPSPYSVEPESFALKEVRYSLPVMLRELQLERSQSFFAREIIDQTEITKIFAQARKARAKRK